MHYAKHTTHQQAPVRADQVKNSAGGYVFKLDPWARLHRFLILGTEGGTYYASERTLTIDNSLLLQDCFAADARRTADLIVQISQEGRAPRVDTLLFSLAVGASGRCGREAASRAWEAMPQVARTASHLMKFMSELQVMRGHGRGLRTGIARWYNGKSATELAHQIIKYRNRYGYTHADLIRISHPKPRSLAHDALFHFAVKDVWKEGADRLEIVDVFLELQGLVHQPKAAAALIRDRSQVTWEMVPPELLAHACVWEALLPGMPIGALLRNLGNLSAKDLLKPLGEHTRWVSERLTNVEALRKARVHPIDLVKASYTYRAGKGLRGKLVWQPVQEIRNALDAALYLSFQNVEPAGKRFLLGIDVSGSMTCGSIAGVPGFSPNVAAAVMALATVRTEPRVHSMGFADEFRDLGIDRQDTLETVTQKTQDRSFGRTDCALPMVWARRNYIEVDTFVVYTDNETWFGQVHPHVALRQYRQETGIDARLAVVGMTATECTIADPEDTGMLDVVGFDTAAPALLSDFAAGRV
ncbi:MAG: RNA-binding protein [Candidatus Hydrogenedentota bacterium]